MGENEKTKKKRFQCLKKSSIYHAFLGGVCVNFIAWQFWVRKWHFCIFSGKTQFFGTLQGYPCPQQKIWPIQPKLRPLYRVLLFFMVYDHEHPSYSIFGFFSLPKSSWKLKEKNIFSVFLQGQPSHSSAQTYVALNVNPLWDFMYI